MWPNPQETSDFFTLTEEILNGKLDFLVSVDYVYFFKFVSIVTVFTNWRLNLATINHSLGILTVVKGSTLVFTAGEVHIWSEEMKNWTYRYGFVVTDSQYIN